LQVGYLKGNAVDDAIFYIGKNPLKTEH
jgi:hypothetical protein